MDDEVILAKALARVFNSLGHETKVCHDGIEALELWESFSPQLVVLDVIMPGMSGIQVMEEVRKKRSTPGFKNSRVVFVTAHSGINDKKAAQEYGAVDVCFKPFDDVFGLCRKLVKLGDSENEKS